MAKFVYLFAFVALLEVATALECYRCDPNGCKDQNKWEKVPNCGKNTDASHVGACLKQSYIDRDNKEMSIKKCVLAEKQGDKIAYTCSPTEGKVTFCEVCNTDLCNSSPVLTFNTVTLLGVALACLVPRLL